MWAATAVTEPLAGEQRAPSTTALAPTAKLVLKCSFFSFRKSDYISPLDDLAFDMYQDPEVAQIIRKLDERKREAVQKERYDYAKKLKQAIADLQKVLLLERTVFARVWEKAVSGPDRWRSRGVGR